MEQLIFKILELCADKCNLTELFQPNAAYLLIALAILYLFTCFGGFKAFRLISAFVVFSLIVLAGFTWLLPAWGLIKCVTFCSIIGVTAAVITFMSYRFAAFVFSAFAAASIFLWSMAGVEVSTVIILFFAALIAAGVGVLTCFFPLWGICGFSALWGGFGFAAEGWRLIGNTPALGPKATVVLGFLLSLAGCVVQLLIFKKQKLFKKIMPQKLEHKIQNSKIERGVAV